MDLTQGMIMVGQYAMRFMDLSHFASYLITDKEKKVEMFKHRLDRRIREHIRAHRIRSFTKLVTYATIIEEFIQESIEYYNRKKHQQ